MVMCTGLMVNTSWLASCHKEQKTTRRGKPLSQQTYFHQSQSLLIQYAGERTLSRTYVDRTPIRQKVGRVRVGYVVPPCHYVPLALTTTTLTYRLHVYPQPYPHTGHHPDHHPDLNCDIRVRIIWTKTSSTCQSNNSSVEVHWSKRHTIFIQFVCLFVA